MTLGPRESERKIRLWAWGSVHVLYALDPNTGSFSWDKRGEVEIQESIIHGLASVEPVCWLIRRFYAVYALGDRLYFQAGKRKWDVTDAEIDTRYWCRFGLVSGFRLILDGKPVHRAILVHPSRALWPLIDPTYDGIDFDSDHFLFFLSEHLKNDDWRERMLSRQPTGQGSKQLG